MAWKYGDPITAEEFDESAERVARAGKLWLSALFRQTAQAKRLGIYLEMTRRRSAGYWCVGWVE